MIKKGVIVAAGLSSRLYPLTRKRPKGLLEINGMPMLKRSIGVLKKNGVDRIWVVVGFRQREIRETLGSTVTYLFNPFYACCNNLGSLWFAKEAVGNDPFLYLHSDLVYDQEMIRETLGHFHQNENDLELVTDFGPTDSEAMKIKTASDRYLIESNKEMDPAEAAGEWVGIAAVRNSRVLFQCAEEILAEENFHAYDTLAFTRMAQRGCKIYCLPVGKGCWVEVDLPEDYEQAKARFG